VKENIIMRIQTGRSAEADFEEKTWTFEMPDGYSVCAGKFAIVPIDEYNKFNEGFLEYINKSGIPAKDRNLIKSVFDGWLKGLEVEARDVEGN
jgi:hypothetical protein